MAGPTQIAVVSVVMLVAACGGTSTSSRMPPQDAARAQASIRAANMAGAQRDPQASAHLTFAKQSASNAQKAAQRGEDESAKLLLNDAKADADLALALTKQQQAAAQCEQAKRRLEGAQ
jgi:S-formylglutathione hydrolase FrmB